MSFKATVLEESDRFVVMAVNGDVSFWEVVDGLPTEFSSSEAARRMDGDISDWTMEVE